MTPREWQFRAPGPGKGETHALHVREWGDPGNPRVVVCVHGLTRNARDFDYLAHALHHRCRVICPDIAGRGQSEWLSEPMAYGYPLYVADMLALLTHLALPKVDWVGTSMGGLIGLFLAAKPESPVVRLVLNDIGPFVATEGLTRIVDYVGKTTEFPNRAEAEAYLRRVHEPFNIQDEAHWRHFFDSSIVAKDGGGVRLAYDPAIAAPLRALERPIQPMDLWAAWEAVRQPVLVLRGAASDILDAPTAQRMAATDDTKLIEYPAIGHAPSLFEHAQIRDIRQWLRV